MFSNALRSSIRQTLSASKPKTWTSNRNVLPSTLSANSSASSLFRRTFIASHVNQQQSVEKRVVRLSRLPFDMSEEALKEFSEKFGSLDRIVLRASYLAVSSIIQTLCVVVLQVKDLPSSSSSHPTMLLRAQRE
jgi:RNA recognition motif-containing protein